MSRPSRLSRSDSMWIRYHAYKLVTIPEPEKSWQWTNVDVSHSALCSLRHRGLIYQVESEWRTDERLYDRLEELGHVDVLDESIGDNSGQLQFSERLLVE